MCWDDGQTRNSARAQIVPAMASPDPRPNLPSRRASALRHLVIALAATVFSASVGGVAAGSPPPTHVTTSSRVDLAGTWRVGVGGTDDWSSPEFDDSTWRSTALPGTWQEQGLEGLAGPIWYRRVVSLQEPLARNVPDGWALLVGRTRFGTVDVWVNGTWAGSIGGPSLEVPVPALHVMAVPRTAIEGHDRLAIAIRVKRSAWASDRAADGGPVGHDLTLGPLRDLVAQATLDRHEELIATLPMLIASLVFLGVALGFSYLWIRWRFAAEHLWFGLVAFGFAANTFLNSPWVFELTERFPLVIRLTEITGLLLAAAFIEFLWTFLKRPVPVLLRAYQASFGVLAIAIAASPSLGWVIDT